MRPLLLCLTSLCLALALAAEEKLEGPWGPEQDGLVCRVTMQPDYCTGEAIRPTVEVKNVGKEPRLVRKDLSWDSSQDVKLSLKEPRQKSYWNGNAQHGNVGPDRYESLKPGEIKRYRGDDLRWLFVSYMQQTGEYELSFSYTLSVPVAREAAGSFQERIKQSIKGQLPAPPVKFVVRELRKGDLTVHEWGVFSIYTDLKHANAGLKAEWDSLPDYFYRQFPKQRLKWSPSAWDKPIVYFYTERNLDLTVKLNFREGAPVVWWPAATHPHVDNQKEVHGAVKPGESFNWLEWQVAVGLEATPPYWDRRGLRHSNDNDEKKQAELDPDCWLLKARTIPAAAPVVTIGTAPDQQGGAPWMAARLEHEKFIYYDGLVPAPDYLRCLAAEGQNLTLKNAAAFPITDLFVVDRRHAAKDAVIRFAHLAAALAPGAEVKIGFREVLAKDWPAAAETEVSAALTQAGLTLDEAKSVVEIWRQGFFMRQGVTAFYLLPQAEYERMLPLQIAPAGAELTRVGIALHPSIDGEPALRDQAAALIAQLDDEDFAARERASKALAGMGGIVFALLEQTIKRTQSAEIKQRCQSILDQVDARSYLLKPPPATRDSNRKPLDRVQTEQD